MSNINPATGAVDSIAAPTSALGKVGVGQWFLAFVVAMALADTQAGPLVVATMGAALGYQLIQVIGGKNKTVAGQEIHPIVTDVNKQATSTLKMGTDATKQATVPTTGFNLIP